MTDYERWFWWFRYWQHSQRLLRASRAKPFIQSPYD